MRKFIIAALVITMVIISLFYAAPGVWASNLAEALPSAPSVIQRTITIYLDSEKVPLQYTAFINTEERAMVSLTDCSLIFDAEVEVGSETMDSRLMVRKGSQEFLLETEDYLYLPPIEGEESAEATLKVDQFYLPLRFVAEQLGCQISYNSQAGAIILRSIDYQGPDPQFAPASPPQLPANLPHWGTLAATPVMAELWPEEDIIAGYYTRLVDSPAGRTHNIILSCSKLNGTMVNSGEVCSFNGTVGPRTAAGGYQTASVFVGKRVVPGIGGGICQTATTLYNSVLESQLPVLERHPHTLPVNYIPVNRDATVSWGEADLKFKNDHPYPIKILAQVYQDYVICAIAAVYNP